MSDERCGHVSLSIMATCILINVFEGERNEKTTWRISGTGHDDSPGIC